ncbi:MAG: serine/threonine-protein kinase [Polyangiales bacterium]
MSEREDPGTSLDALPETRRTDEPAEAPAQPGAVAWPLVGSRYAPHAILGCGGMATVFAATDLRTGAAVAIKRPHRACDATLEAAVIAEARAMARVAHPNVARVLDAGIDPQGPWLVLERLEGESLHARIVREGARTTWEVAGVMLAVLAGVQAIHGCGIAHGDLKPSNVILARVAGGVVPKVIDFGVASHLAGHEQAPELLGTPMYMAPERFTHRAPPSVASDVWSLGALLYTCLAGAVPFDGARVADVVAQVLTHAPRPLPGVPPALCAVIDRAMQRAPEDRFASAHDMGLALRAALRASPRG